MIRPLSWRPEAACGWRSWPPCSTCRYGNAQILREVLDWSAAEVAEALGTTPAAVEENAAAVDSNLTEADLADLEPIAGQVLGAGRPRLTPERPRLLAGNA